MYKNYVFDLYGTLADIHTDEGDPKVWEALTNRYTESGAVYKPDELQTEYCRLVEIEKADVQKRHPEFTNVDIQVEKVFRTLYEQKGITASDEEIAQTALLFRRASREYIHLYDGIEELLAALSEKANVYLLTNAQRGFTWDELNILGIRKYFDGIVISSDEECCKPDKSFYNAIIKRYSLDPKETIMSGNDPVADIKGGKNADFDTLYIHTNISPEFDENAGATYTIANGDTLKMKDYLL